MKRRPLSFYQKVLPLNEATTIKEQFGWFPTSIFKPEKRPYLENIVKDEGEPGGKTRRSADCKYLPKLRYSRFHPHLAEAVIRYWSLPGDLIVDPFAGRSTRAVVAAFLDRNYIGFEVVPKVAAKTQENADEVRPGAARILNSDGVLLKELKGSDLADLVFTCPPYHRLERYESVPGQLSDIKRYEDFLSAIEICARNIFRVLKPGKFLAWVCADWRDGKAFRLFHFDSLRIFLKAGLEPWDIVIIHNLSPFAALQAGKVAAKRYTSKIHEYLLVFRKPRKGGSTQ